MTMFKCFYTRSIILIGFLFGFTFSVFAQNGITEVASRNLTEKFNAEELLYNTKIFESASNVINQKNIEENDNFTDWNSASFPSIAVDIDYFSSTQQDTFLAYPNPTSGIINIEIISSKDVKTKVIVYNLLGSQVMEFQLSLHSGKNLKQLDLGNLSPGNYFLNIIIDNKSKSIVISKTE